MANLQYHIIKPAAALGDIVRYFWTFEGSASLAMPYTLRTIANGCPELLFHYQGAFDEMDKNNQGESFLTGVHGQTGIYRRFSVNERFGIFGVYLYPYALRSLFGIPAIEFTDQLPSLDAICGQTWNNISERMLLATDNEHRLSIITDFLMKRKRALKRNEIAYAVRKVIDLKGDVNVKALSDQCFRSHRQFERNFKEETGFTAKTFSRIVRFNSLISDYKNAQVPLTQVAFDFGYYDQSHFIHDFKAFSGYNPSTYFSGNAEELP